MIDEEYDYYDNDDEDIYRNNIDGVGFADPGGESALRAATKDNPRNLPCGNCGWPNRLTPIDVQRGYQCDACAEAITSGRDIYYYEGPEDSGQNLVSGDPEYIYSIVMLVQVDVEATSQEVALEKATTDKNSWTNWNLVDTPAGPEIVNNDP